MKFIVVFAIFVAVSAADVKKLDSIIGGAKFLKIDSKGVSYIVTTEKLKNSDHFYVLNVNNDVIFSQTYESVASVLFNPNEELYLFESLTSNRTMVIWTFDQNSSVMVRQQEFEPSKYWSSFFDNDGNLFFNSKDGINILRKNEQTPIVIANMDGYVIINDMTHAVDVDGNVYIGIGTGSSDSYDTAVIIPKEEISKPDPIFYQINAKLASLYNMVAFNDSIYFGTEGSLIRFKDDNHYLMIELEQRSPIFLTPVNDRLYLRYVNINDNSLPFYVALKFVTPDYEIHDVTGYLREDLVYFDQTVDGDGNVFIGGDLFSSEGGSAVFYLRHNETVCTQLNVPNSIFIFGLAASRSGDLWILSQNLYVVPRGTSNAVKVAGFPKVAKSWPMIAKPLTDEVLIGSDDGVYVATAV